MLFLVTALLYALPATAQNYKGAVGLRLGSPVSVSAKYFLGETTALEGYIGRRGYTYSSWVTVGLAAQKHKPLNIIDEVEGLSYYYGAGVNAYFWSYKDTYFRDDDTNISYGISGYIGFDYAFEDLPINITLDWVPTFFINSYLGGFGGRYGSLGVRYVFARGD